MNTVVKDRRDIAAWVIIAGVVLATIVLGILDRKSRQNV